MSAYAASVAFAVVKHGPTPPPGWMPPVAAAVIVITLAVVLIVWITSDGPDGSGPDSGGGGGRPPDRPRPPEPPWWPDFERQFAEYVRRAPSHPTAAGDRQPRGSCKPGDARRGPPDQAA